MADTQEVAEPAISQPGSLVEAQNALLGLMDSTAVEEPETEEASTAEEETSTEANPDEESEAVSEEESEEEDESEESESEEPEEEDEEPVYAVKVDGDEIEVSLDELLNGYSRQSSFTKKSQQLADDRREMETLQQQYNSEVSQIQQERQQYANYLQSVIESSNLDQWASIDWETLKQEDPIEYVTKKEEAREAQERVAGIQQRQYEATQKAQADAKHQWQQTVQTEHAHLVGKLPEWGEPEKQRELAGKLRSYAQGIGYEDAEIDQLVDHRSFIVLNKARLYDELQTSNVKSKKLKNKPKVIRGGKGASKKLDVKEKRTRQRNRLQETGKVEDAAVLLEELLA